MQYTKHITKNTNGPFDIKFDLVRKPLDIAITLSNFHLRFFNFIKWFFHPKVDSLYQRREMTISYIPKTFHKKIKKIKKRRKHTIKITKKSKN